VNDAIGAQLRLVVATYGLGICEDARRVEALLRDLSGEHRREIFVLAGAVREGVPAELLAATGTVPAAMLQERLSRMLEENLGLGGDAARWAVATWASALDAAGHDPAVPAPGDQGGTSAVAAGLAVAQPPQVPATAPQAAMNVSERLLALPLDQAGDTAWRVLGLLACALGPLTMDDIADLVELPVRQVHRAIEPIADLIIHDGHLEIAGNSMRQAVTEYLGRAERGSAAQRMASWCADWCSQLTSSQQHGHDVPGYVVRYGATHLHDHGAAAALDQLVDEQWMRLSATRTGSLLAFAGDMLLAADSAASGSPPRRLTELRATAAYVTVMTAAEKIPPEALAVLAFAGQHKRAMDLAALVEPRSRSDAYQMIAMALLGSGNSADADAAAAEAISAADAYLRDCGDKYPLRGLVYAFVKDGTAAWASQALAAFQSSAGASADENFVEVSIALKAGNIDRAWEIAKAMAGASGKNSALANVAEALAQSGRVNEAVAVAQTVEQARWVLGKVVAIAAQTGEEAKAMTVIRSAPESHRDWIAGEVAETWARLGRIDEAVAVARAIADERRREDVVEAIARVLAGTKRGRRAVEVLAEVADEDDMDRAAADLAKVAAEAGDLDGSLEIIATITDSYLRRRSFADAAIAVAGTGDLRQAAEVVHMIGTRSAEDEALAEIVKDLAGRGHLDHAAEVAETISRPYLTAGALAEVSAAFAKAGQYLRSVALAEQSVAVAETLGNEEREVRALNAWATALGLSGQAGEAAAAAERAVAIAGAASDVRLAAEALATWSVTLTMAARGEEAAAAAGRAVESVQASNDMWREDILQDLARVLAEAGPPEWAMAAAQSVTNEWDRDKLLGEMAALLARRGLAGHAIAAVQDSPYVTPHEGKERLGKVLRILAEHGHGEEAVRVANAIPQIGRDEDDTAFADMAEHEVVIAIRDIAGLLAENGWVDAALSVARTAEPSWNRPEAHNRIACALAQAGDLARAVQVAEMSTGYQALAKVASSLAESGRVGDALPLAEKAIASVLAAPPASPSADDAIAVWLPVLTDAADDGAATASPEDDTGGQAQADESAAAVQQAVAAAMALASDGERAEALSGIGSDGEKVATLAEQALLLARVGWVAEAGTLAGDVLTLAKGPIGAWRGDIVSTVVQALLTCGEADRAVAAARAAPVDTRPDCLAAAAAALLAAGEHDKAAASVCEAFAAVRAGGRRFACYHLLCHLLPRHPELFRAWLGDGTSIGEIGRELAELERWWAN